MQEANLRSEIGHFECDSIESKRVKGQSKSCLTVLVDRKSRYTDNGKEFTKHEKLTGVNVFNS